MLRGESYKADLSDWDIIMGYNFMVSSSAGALHIAPESFVTQTRRFHGYPPIVPLVDLNGPERRNKKLFVR